MKKASLTPGSLFDGLPTVDRFHVYPKTRTREDVIKENENFLKRLERLENIDVKKRSTIYGPWVWSSWTICGQDGELVGETERYSHESDDAERTETARVGFRS